MSIKIIIGYLFLLLLWSNSLEGQERTKKIDRLIEKQIAKIWKGQSIQQNRINTKTNIDVDLFFNENHLYSLDEIQELRGYLLLRRGYGCKIGGCGNAEGQGEGQICSGDGNAYEVFDYAIILDTNLTILKVMVVDYPGDYGYEITSKGWLKQFVGYKGEDLSYGKEVDAISGATISANSITTDIVAVYKMLKYFLEDKRTSLSKY